MYWLKATPECKTHARQKEHHKAKDPLQNVERECGNTQPAVQTVHIWNAFLLVELEYSDDSYKRYDQCHNMQCPVEDLRCPFGFMSKHPKHQQRITTQEDHSQHHAKRVHIKLLRSIPGKSPSVLGEPSSCNCQCCHPQDLRCCHQVGH